MLCAAVKPEYGRRFEIISDVSIAVCFITVNSCESEQRHLRNLFCELGVAQKRSCMAACRNYTNDLIYGVTVRIVVWVTEPDVAVIVTVFVEVTALVLTVNRCDE